MAGTPHPVWRGALAPALLRRIVNPVAGARYNLDADGTRFLVLERTAEGSGPALLHPIVVLGRPMLSSD